MNNLLKIVFPYYIIITLKIKCWFNGLKKIRYLTHKHISLKMYKGHSGQ